MKLKINADNFPLTPNLECYIREQVTETMRSFSHSISKLSVSLTSIQQPSGDVDPQCRVEVEVKDHPKLVVIKRSYNVQSTIRSAILNAGWSTVKALEKQEMEAYYDRIGRVPLGRNRLQGITA